MYYSTNLPKEMMGYPDFPIPEQSRSYIPQKDMHAFLELYAKTFNLYDHIKFKHHVVRVRPYGDTRWEIIVRDLPNNKYDTYTFDAIIICNGRYHTPSIPPYSGRDIYKGKQIHSHDFRTSEPFKGKTFVYVYRFENCVVLFANVSMPRPTRLRCRMPYNFHSVDAHRSSRSQK